MDEIGQRLDDLGRAVTRDRIPSGLADVYRRAARRRRNARAGTALGTVAIVLAAGIGYGALRDRDPATVTSPAPSAQASPEPTPSPSEVATPTPSPTPGVVRETQYPASRPGELPRATVDYATTRPGNDEPQQFGITADLATFGRGLRPERVTATEVEVAYESLWVPATDGVVRLDPYNKLQPVAFVPTGTVRAMASSGYASMYAAVELEDGGLGVASWNHGGSTVRVITIDATPGAAETVGDTVGFAESLFLTRTYPDRPAELLNISPANGTFDVISRMGGPHTRLVVDRAPGDSSTELWVGSSEGVLRHIDDDGTETDFRIGGSVLDVDATLGEAVWLAVARAGNGPARPVRIDARTGKVTADVTSVVAREIAVEPGNAEFDGAIWTSSGDLGHEGVDLAVLAGKTGNPISTWRAAVKGVTDLVFDAVGGWAYGVSVEQAGVVRLGTEGGEGD